MVAAATAVAVALAGGHQAYWVCVPAALLVATTARPLVAAVGSGLVLAAAIVAGAATEAVSPEPLAGAGLIAAASVLILLGVRNRLERERDAMRASALTDPLTGVANRRSLLARIEYEIARHARARRSFAVVMLDLDGFKLVNDNLGHPAGDLLLCDVAAALETAVRAQDTVARIGGDEFCVLAPETDTAGAGRLADRATRSVSGVAAGIHTRLGAGAGAAIFPDDGTTIDQLITAADRRLLAAKSARRVPDRRAA